jgi:putative methionine-R-sulfoxide reductase with GAF domain
MACKAVIVAKNNAEQMMLVQYWAEKDRDAVASSGNVCASLFEYWNRIAPNSINWCGMYFVAAGELRLGPFQGKPAVTRIPFSKGVCGCTYREARTIVRQLSSPPSPNATGRS